MHPARGRALLALVLLAAGAWWYMRPAGAAAASSSSGGAWSLPSIDFESLFAGLMPAPVASSSAAPERVSVFEQLDTAAGELLESVRAVVAPGAWSLPAAGEPYRALIEAAESQYGIPPMLLARTLYEESRFRADIIEGRTASSAGALGIAQFMPATAAQLGVDPLDPASAIDGAGRYLAQLYAQTGEWRSALAAYNWGIGNVKRKGIAAAPAETRRYVAAIAGAVGLA